MLVIQKMKMSHGMMNSKASINSSVGETLNRISHIAWLGFRGTELLDMDAYLRVDAA